MTARFAVSSSRVATPDGIRPAAIVVSGRRIEAVVPRDEAPSSAPVEDFGDWLISPGIVDSHVHINEPGRADWEGFETATRAAAAGGVTTLVDMPLNSDPVTTTAAALEAKRAAAQGSIWVDVGFYGGLVAGGGDEVEPLIRGGVCGIKAFLCDSGLPEFPKAAESDLRRALPQVARAGVPLLVHAEVVPAGWPPRIVENCRDWADLRSVDFELEAIALLVRLCREFHAPIHIVHLSSREAAEAVDAAKRRRLPLTAETCPHYLHFAVDELPHADAYLKCSPPVRGVHDREGLWAALSSGVIDTIGSDHSPCPPAMKLQTPHGWHDAWGGISSLQLTLPAVWAGAQKRSLPLARLADWLSAAPARLIGMSHRKGRLAPGLDADLCIWDPDATWNVRGDDLYHRHKGTAYEGQLLRGRVERTYVRGRLAYDAGSFRAGPIGELLCRSGGASP